MNGQSLVKGFVPLPGGATAVYTSSGLDHYRHSDWLGSARVSSSPSRAYLSGVAYSPWGETYASSGTADLSFTGQNSDTSSGDYDFLFREYGTQGRWPSPDPADLAAVDTSNPQSWNRYAYVLNIPLSFIDPTGLWCTLPDGTHTDPVSAGGIGADECAQRGGTWSCDPNAICITVHDHPPSGESGGSDIDSVLLDFWQGHCPAGWHLEPVPFGPARCVPGHQLGDFVREPRWKSSGPQRQGPTLQAARRPSPPSSKKVTRGCMTGALAQNFLGDEQHAGASLVVNVAAYAAVRRLAPALFPGPGWMYVGIAVVYDAAQITKSYIDCKQNGGPSLE